MNMKNDFPEKRLQLSLRFTEVAVYFLKSQNEWVLSQTVSTKQHKNFMHFFIKTLQNCDNQSFQENSTEKVCFNESLFLYNGKALGAESSTTGCSVEKKILYFWKAFGETNHTGGLDWALCNKTW